MGLYSVVRCRKVCHQCGTDVIFAIQFKYGNLYAHEYEVGDLIVWGRTQVGDPNEAKVAVQGIGTCPACGNELDFDIVISSGVIRSVAVSQGAYDYRGALEGYVVLAD
jgi:hypothetical protein